MALRINTQIAGDVFILLCDGRIVFGDEDAILRDRVRSMLPGTPTIVVNLKAVDYIDSAGLGVLVGLFASAKTAVANSSWSLPPSALRGASPHEPGQDIQGLREQRGSGRSFRQEGSLKESSQRGLP